MTLTLRAFLRVDNIHVVFEPNGGVRTFELASPTHCALGSYDLVSHVCRPRSVRSPVCPGLSNRVPENKPTHQGTGSPPLRAARKVADKCRKYDMAGLPLLPRTGCLQSGGRRASRQRIRLPLKPNAPRRGETCDAAENRQSRCGGFKDASFQCYIY